MKIRYEYIPDIGGRKLKVMGHNISIIPKERLAPSVRDEKVIGSISFLNLRLGNRGKRSKELIEFFFGEKKEWFYIQKPRKSIRGYIRVLEKKTGEEKYIGIADSMMPVCLAASTLMMVAAVTLALGAVSGGEKVYGKEKAVKAWNSDRIVNGSSNLSGHMTYAQVPGYSQINICSDEGVIPLVNPQENQVDLSYMVKNNQGEKLVETGLISPGEEYSWDAVKDLERGENDVVISITSFKDNKTPGNTLSYATKVLYE